MTGRSLTRGFALVAGLLLTVSTVLAVATPALADPPNIDFIDRLGCGPGLVPLATFSGPGADVPSTRTSTADQPVARLSTATSGLPPVAMQFTGDEGSYDLFATPSPFSGAALDPEYTLGSFEVYRPDPDAVVAWHLDLPTAQRVFFSLLDVEYSDEAFRVRGLDGGTVVSPRVVSRALPGGEGVSISAPDASGWVSVVGDSRTHADFDVEDTADVVFEAPVDRIEFERFTDATTTSSISAEVSTLYGCQGLDVTKAASIPTRVAGTTYDVPFTVRVGNTAPAGDTPVYAPQVTDDLAGLVDGAGAGPAGAVDVVNGLTSTGPGPACTTNPAYDGTTVTDLLAGTGSLAPEESCTVSFTARVTFDPFEAAFSRLNSAEATSAAATATTRGAFPGRDVSTSGAVLPTAVHADTAEPTGVTFAPAVEATPAPTPTPSVTPTPTHSATPSPSAPSSTAAPAVAAAGEPAGTTQTAAPATLGDTGGPHRGLLLVGLAALTGGGMLILAASGARRRQLLGWTLTRRDG